uniref:Uncharacterized protein n=1 Tax=viral metagenome TaxID=1070528 RepID=A0A6M3X451_9ZZZZ
MPIRFRTQDTRAATRRKLNELFALTGDAQFTAPSPTLEQWAKKLNAIRAQMVIDEFVFDQPAPYFRTSDTRQMWTRKLNKLAVSYEAGVPAP